jgi:hypothetical protein
MGPPEQDLDLVLEVGSCPPLRLFGMLLFRSSLNLTCVGAMCSDGERLNAATSPLRGRCAAVALPASARSQNRASLLA